MSRPALRALDVAGDRAAAERRPLLNPAEAGRHLGITRRAVMDFARRGDLACMVYRRGRDGRASIVAFDPADLDAFIESHRKEVSR